MLRASGLKGLVFRGFKGLGLRVLGPGGLGFIGFGIQRLWGLGFRAFRWFAA